MLQTIINEYDCPVCKNKAEDSTGVLLEYASNIRTDFKPVCLNDDIYFPLIYCYGCGYSGVADDFENVDPCAALNVLEFLSPEASSVSNKAKKYENAAICAQWNGKPLAHIGELWLKASWYADELSARIKDYRINAITSFDKALIEGGIAIDKTVEYVYLIGELFRRIGDNLSARMWFNRVQEETVCGNGKMFARLANQQVNYPKEFIYDF